MRFFHARQKNWFHVAQPRRRAHTVAFNKASQKSLASHSRSGARVDANMFDPETAFVASATGEGTIHIIHEDSPDKFSVVETVHTEFGAKTMALDPKTHNLFVDTSDFDSPGAAMSKQPNPQRRLSRECSGC